MPAEPPAPPPLPPAAPPPPPPIPPAEPPRPPVAPPAPDVTLLDFTLAGPVLAVRPYTPNEHYWQVFFDTNELIRKALGDAGFAVPETHHHVNRG